MCFFLKDAFSWSGPEGRGDGRGTQFYRSAGACAWGLHSPTQTPGDRRTQLRPPPVAPTQDKLAIGRRLIDRRCGPHRRGPCLSPSLAHTGDFQRPGKAAKGGLRRGDGDPGLKPHLPPPLPPTGRRPIITTPTGAPRRKREETNGGADDGDGGKAKAKREGARVRVTGKDCSVMLAARHGRADDGEGLLSPSATLSAVLIPVSSPNRNGANNS